LYKDFILYRNEKEIIYSRNATDLADNALDAIWQTKARFSRFIERD